MTSTVFTLNLAGHVRHQGLPVAQVSVFLEDQYPGAAPLSLYADRHESCQRTGQRGEFTFAVKPGTYRLTFLPDPWTRYLRQTFSEISVASNATLNVNLTIGCILTVRPRTANGAFPHQGEMVALGIEPTSYQCSATANEEGEYNLVLPKGKFHLAFGRGLSDLSPLIEADLNSRAFIATSVKVIEVEGDSTYDLELSNLVKLKGTLTDMLGQSLAKAHVWVVPTDIATNVLFKELGLGAHLLTDEKGTFEVDVEPGLYDIKISPDQASRTCELHEQGVEITSDLKRTFQLPEGHRLKGKVSYGEGALNDCLVRVVGTDRKLDVVTKTDEKGHFSVGVPAGNYRLIVAAHPKDASHVIPKEDEHQVLAPWTRVIVVGGDTHVDVRLKPGSSVRGRISDGCGHVRVGVPVHVFAEPDRPQEGEVAEWALTTAWTNADGRFSFNLAEGKYWCVIHQDVAHASLVEIGGEPILFDVDWADWCQVKFEVVSESGQPIPRCLISYASYGTNDFDLPDTEHKDRRTSAKRSMLTGEDGTGIVTVPSGVYTLRFKPPQDGSYDSRTIRQISISNDLTKTIKLPLKQDCV